MKRFLSLVLTIALLLSIVPIGAFSITASAEAASDTDAKFTIAWRNSNGELLGTTSCDYGEIPMFEGETPARESDSQYTYTFTGWQPEIKAAYSDAVYIATYSKTERNSYTIIYNANGGSDAPASQTKAPGQTIKLNSNKPTWQNHVFLGWSCAYNDTLYQAGENFNIDADAMLYAVWKNPCSYCDGKGGSYTYSTCTTCNGTGDGSIVKCSFCYGTGKKCANCGSVSVTIIQGLGQVCSSCGSTSRRNCASCNGQGSWMSDYCTTCGGDGITSSFKACYWCDGDQYVETSFSRTVYMYSDDSLTGSKTIYTKRPYQLTVPSKTGYSFIGWFDSPNGGTQYTNSEGVSLAVCPDSPSSKLYAHWSLNYYTITYDCDQNVNTDNMPVVYTVEDEDFVLDNQSHREHYNFYWSILDTEVESFDTSTAQDVVVKGIWDPINYTITYNLDGGTANNRTTYNIETDTFSLAEPTKTGYIFTGWTGSNGNIPEKNVTISTEQPQNLSFTANWTIAVYTIIYELFGGENSLKNPDTFTMIDNIILKDAKKDNYTFAGWYLDSEFTKKITNINGYHNDLTLYALFVPHSFTATFDPEEGDLAHYNITLAWGGNLQNEIISYKTGDTFYPYEVDLPSRSGYLFNGWYLDSSLSTPLPETYIIASDTTLYAKWFKQLATNAEELTLGDYRYTCYGDASKTVYFYVSPEHSGETVVSYYLRGYKYDGVMERKSEFSIKDLTTGTTLFSKNTLNGSGYTVNSFTSITLVAGHTYQLYTYTINNSYFNGEADIIISIGEDPFPPTFVSSAFATYEEKYGETIQYPVPIRNDYDFVGWYDIDGNPIHGVWDYTTDKTFYPQWKLHEFTINYNLNGGTNSSSNPLSYTIADSVITLLDPSREEYTFLGWYTDPNFQNQITEINCEDRLDYTLHAKWVSDFFEVNYELNGGVNNPSNKQRIGRTEEFTLLDPTREGYTFAGWYLESYYSTKVTTLYGSAHRDQKVYAKWTPNSYTATLDYSGGQNCPTVEFISQGNVIKTVDLYKDTTLSYFTPEAPTANLKFAGWYTNSSCTTLFNFNGIVNYDVTIYAKWVSVNTNYEYVSLGGSYDVSISGIESQYLAIMSPIMQTVTVSSVSGLDLFGSIYDSNMNSLYSCDDISDENLDFSITFVMEAGKVYYIAYKANQVFVSGNATINVSGTQNPDTFITGDYTAIIERVDVIYASSFELPVPKRNGYVFLGWFDENDTQITEGIWNFATNKNLTAKWAECYTVIFKDFAGNIISSQTYCFGEEIVAPEVPTKAPDETYIYHTKWGNDYTGICTGDAVYFPTFDLEYVEYTVVFVNADGTELSKATYHWNDVITPPADPTKGTDADYANIYTFAGWDNDVVNCAGDATYTATYTAVPLKKLVLASKPNQVRYRTGESLNLTGLVLQCIYANNVSISLNSVNAQFVSADLSTPGRKNVTITIADKSVEFEIYVHDTEKAVVNVDSSLYPESSHNYSNNLTETKTFTYPGALSITITFNGSTFVEYNHDYIYIYDSGETLIAKYTGAAAANKTLTIAGDTFKVILITNYAYTYYGYAFSLIQANMKGEIIHEPVTDPATVTCSQAGLTEGSHCGICGDVLVEQKEVAALGHAWDTGSITTAPTCEQDGVKSFDCTRCDEKKTESIPSTGHNYEATVTAPTCTEGGYTTYICSVCSDSYIADEVNALEHAEVIDAAVTPSCTATGLTEGKHCSACNEVLIAQEVVDALGHGYEAVVTAPTCTEGGYTTYTCSTCGDIYIDDEVNALGHAWDDGFVATAATCTIKGEKGFTCGNCGETRSEDIAPLGHSYNAVVTAPTCTEGGYTTYTCSACVDSHIADELDALGHRFDWATVVPSCTEAGYTICTCSVCGYGYTEEGEAAFGHEYSNGTCVNCGEEDPDYLPENPFVDVKENDYFFTPVLWAVQKGITNGISATEFGPNANCTRGQIVTFLWRACGSPEPTKTDNPFTDVKPTDYYYKAVLWAVESGITNGMSATTFAPNATCTRGQVATFLWRSQGNPAPESSSNPFKDVKSGEYYYSAVLWAVENGITNGTGIDTFSPNASCTRGQIVTFLYRTLN